MCSRADDFEDVDREVDEGVDDIVDVADFETISAHETFDIARGVAGDVATDNVVVDFVGVADVIGVVSMHVMTKKKSFEVEVDDEAVEAFATAKIEKKDSDSDADLSVFSSCFSNLLM